MNFQNKNIPTKRKRGVELLRTFLRKEQKIIINTGWLLSEKIIIMGMSLLASIVLARYLGTEQFGQLNYCLAYVYIFLVFSNLGTENILLKEFNVSTQSHIKIIHSAFTLRLIAGILSVSICLLIAFFLNFEEEIKLLIFIVSTQLIFQAFGIYRTYFNSKVKSKYPVIIKNISVVTFTIAKLLLVYFHQPIEFIILTYSLEILLEGLLLFVLYNYLYGSVKKLSISLTYIVSLFKMSYPLVLSGMFYVMYAKMDMVMLGKLSTQEQVGFYAVATRLSEVWYFIPSAIITSIFPAILKLKQADKKLYHKKLENIFTLLSYISFFLAISVSFISDPLINLLYGIEFADSSKVLIIHIWCGVIVFSGTLSGAWFVAEDLQKLSFYRTGLGALLNIILNLIFIPKYGAIGAAVSTLAAKIVASYLANAIHPLTRPIFKLQSRAFLNTITFKF